MVTMANKQWEGEGMGVMTPISFERDSVGRRGRRGDTESRQHPRRNDGDRQGPSQAPKGGAGRGNGGRCQMGSTMPHMLL